MWIQVSDYATNQELAALVAEKQRQFSDLGDTIAHSMVSN